MIIRHNGIVIERVSRGVTLKRVNKVTPDFTPRRSRLSKYRRGTNQYQAKSRDNWKKTLPAGLALMTLLAVSFAILNSYLNPPIVSPLPKAHAQEKVSGKSAEVKIVSPTPTVAPEPTPTELEEIVAYIARKFEPEGKAVVVRAINCFYSESGLRSNAVGQNTDGPRSKDHGVAQLNDYWHKLTPAQKTDIKANIDKAYDIYKGRGDNFSAWYGKLCNI